MPKLFAVMLGGRAENFFIEQHDVVFVVGNSLEETYPHLINKWHGSPRKLHIDSSAELKCVDGYEIQLSTSKPENISNKNLFFINFGGYKQDFFGELHDVGFYVAESKADAVLKAKFNLCVGTHEQHCDDHKALDELSHIENDFIDDVLTIHQISQYYVQLIPTKKPNEIIIDSYYRKLDLPPIMERANALKNAITA